MQIKLELSEKHLKDAKEKIFGASTSSSMSSHSEDLKNIGMILNEVDYFKLCHINLLLLSRANWNFNTKIN